MQFSRRNFLSTTGLGAAAAVAAQFSREDLFGQVRRARPDGAIFLNSNENAYGPSEVVLSAMRDALTKCNRYPDAQYERFVAAVAAAHKVSPEQVLVGNGSTEILRVAINAFASRERGLVTPVPTFEAISEYAASFGVPVSPVRLTPQFSHDLDKMLAAARNAGVVYLCNPNNPTGTLTPRKDLDTFLKSLPDGTYAVVDEAYHHFAEGPEYRSLLAPTVDHPRVIVARTFSKIYGLAGIRLGYAVASKETIARMQPYRLQDNLNMVACQCGAAALQDESGAALATRRNAADRAEFMKQATVRKLNPLPSQCNFVMMDSRGSVPPVVQYFKRNGIWIGRDFHFGDRVRISLGTPAEMARFWTVWDGMPSL